MNFLLIRAGKWKSRGKGAQNSPVTHPPLGLLYVGASLEEEGHDVEVLDFYFVDITIDKLKESLKTADAVGMSVYTVNYKQAAEIASIIKKIRPDIKIIIGGPHCTFLKEKALVDIPDADISVCGEGEYAIKDVAKYLKHKKSLSNINGIYYKEKNKIKTGKPLKVIQNLNTVILPARHLVADYDYGDFPYGYSLKKKVTAMISGRGCPFKCRFCSRYSRIIKEWGCRLRSAENVVEELVEINKDYNTVLMVDDNFLVDVKRAHKILDLMIEKDIKLDIFVEGARVETASKKLYKKMKKAGVVFIEYGIESGNQDVLDFYNKNITIKQIRRAVKLGSKAGLQTSATFILGAPIETKAHFEKTINFACSIPLDLAFFGSLHYIMGSDLWLEEVKKGNISKDEYCVGADVRRGLGSFTTEEIRSYSIKAYKKFYNRPNYLFVQALKAVLRKDFKFITGGANYIMRLNKKKSLKTAN